MFLLQPLIEKANLKTMRKLSLLKKEDTNVDYVNCDCSGVCFQKSTNWVMGELKKSICFNKIH